ncbi:two-component system histidine protein kinase, sensor protein [Lactiplantibacillus pentosus KCA1]|nr:GHKL domain-containing protein [Lactiplantibacillus pentosus]EIW13016.1 two-component system histidine protein kinase, sensor protein [Lactiplantibacillus pentosus KCA1]
MATVFFVLSLSSGLFEMLFLMIAFREYVTWRISIVWVLLIWLAQAFGEVCTLLFPHVPLVFFWIIPLVAVNTFMSSRLLYTKWLLMLPVAIFLNAVKRLISAVIAVAAKALMAPTAPMLLRQAIGFDITADLNILVTVIIDLPIVLALAFMAHRWLVRVSAADFLQRARVDASDYLLVLLFFIIYVIAYVFAMEWTVNSQTYMAIAASVTFGIIGLYLINNKNSHLNDAQLLLEVSNYNELLSHHNRDLHLFKHDYQNVLLSLSSFIKNDDMPGLKQYFETEVLPSSVRLNQQSELASLSRLAMPTVSGLIYAKHDAAMTQHVNLLVYILEDVELPNVPQIKVVRILGNLLDNAIDAALRADQQVKLTVTNQDEHTVSFTVQNQIPNDEALDLSVIKKSRFTTKPGHLGYGLSSIEQLTTDKLRVNYAIEDTDFVAELIVEG